MAKAKTKKKVYTNVTLEDANAASEKYSITQNSLAKEEAKMNEELNKVKSKYVDKISDLKEELSEPEEILHAFASEQKESWGKKKSLELLHTIIGFRTGTPKVSKDKKFTWDAVLELMKKNKAFKKLIRQKDEINKENILALKASDEKDKPILDLLKEEAYVFVEQDENFFVEAKLEEV